MITSRISVVSKATPAMRAFSTSGPMSLRPEKVEASTDAPELADFGCKGLLRFDPTSFGGRRERCYTVLAERGRAVSAKEFAQGIEPEHARGVVEE